jgi:hypothetical protein
MAGSIHEQLVELLARLGDRAAAEKHARHIHAAVLAASRGHDIGQEDIGYFARARHTKSPGPAKEFRDLASMARKAIRGKIGQEDWIREWASRPPSVWRACRPFLLERNSRALDRTKLLGFSVPGTETDVPSAETEPPAPIFTTIVPKPAAVLPALEIAVELGRIATGNKKQRKPDLAAYDVIAAVRSAYSALTGRRGGRAILESGLPGRHLRLGHDIDRLFGTNFFPPIDSVRLR